MDNKKKDIIESLGVEDLDYIMSHLDDSTTNLSVCTEFFDKLHYRIKEYYSVIMQNTESDKIHDVEVEYSQVVMKLCEQAEKTGVHFENPHDLLLRG